MYCHRCGEIVLDNRKSCSVCGGRPVDSTTASAGVTDRKDPWSSAYLQRRLKPSNIASNNKPASASSSAGGVGMGHSRPLSFDYGSTEQPPPRSIVRNATGAPSCRPTSMYAGDTGLKPKWSQYFTTALDKDTNDNNIGLTVSTSALPNGRGRSDSLLSTPQDSPRSMASNNSRFSVAASAAAAAVVGVSNPKPFSQQQNRPSTSDGGYTGSGRFSSMSQQSTSPSLANRKANNSSSSSNLYNRPSTTATTHSARTGSVLSYTSSNALRSRSATLPDAVAAATAARGCDTCNKQLRPEQQRQFASKPGIVFCGDCYHSSYSRGHCAGCNKIVLTNGRPWVQSGSRVWHKLCIKCRDCNKLLLSPLLNLQGEPTCEPCFMKTNPNQKPQPLKATPTVIQKPQTAPSKQSLAQMATEAASVAAMPTPAASEYERAPSDLSSRFGGLGLSTGFGSSIRSTSSRVMSPVEIAEKEGLPLPRPIIDPDLGGISTDSPSPLPPPLSPSLKDPSSPTGSRMPASPRSVSFQLDNEDKRKDDAEKEEEESLADYVRSQIPSTASSAAKPRSTTLPSVADTIKKLGGSKLNHSSHQQKRDMPELQDMMRTHRRDTPKEATIPTIDKQNRILKSRPRNQQRRAPTATPPPPPPLQIQEEEEEVREEEELVPNQCARCSEAIADTWFRLSDGRQVHVECFTCQACETLIEDGVYVLDNGVEFHPNCVPATPPVVSVSSNSNRVVRGPRAPRKEDACDRCGSVLSGPRFQLTNGRQYHPECFACAGCSQRFDEGSYVCFEGREYHHHCVKALNNSGYGDDGQQQQQNQDEDQLVCAACQNLVEGVFLRHDSQVFHPPCFCCVDCHRPIAPGMPFGEVDDARPCCEGCLEHRASLPVQQKQTAPACPL